MKTITMKEMLETMESGNPFSVSFVTFDRQRKTGGKVRQIKQAILNKHIQKDSSSTDEQPKPQKKERVRESRNPHHFENSTRSIRILVNGCKTSTVKKLHIFLVLKFNDKKLML